MRSLSRSRFIATDLSHRERVQSGGGLIFDSAHGAPGLKGWFREDMRLPYCTTMAGAQAAVEGIRALKTQPFEVRPLQDFTRADFSFLSSRAGLPSRGTSANRFCFPL